VYFKRCVDCAIERAARSVAFARFIVSKVVDLPNQKKPIAQELVETMEEVEIDLVNSFIANFDDLCDLIWPGGIRPC
jgi:hypothetical protein